MEKVTTTCIHFTMSLVLYKQKLSMKKLVTREAGFELGQLEFNH